MKRREGGAISATTGETARAIAKPPTPRAAFIAARAAHVKALALAGDVAAARVASDAIVRFLGLTSRNVGPCARTLENEAARTFVKWALSLLVTPVAGFVGLMLTFTRPVTELEVLVPVSFAGSNACLVEALGTEFGPRLRTEGNFTTVEHESCLNNDRENAVLYYEITVRDAKRFLAVSQGWRPSEHVTANCARATGAEIGRAIEAFARECEPGLAGRWESRCVLSGANASENFCPDPLVTRGASDGGTPDRPDDGR